MEKTVEQKVKEVVDIITKYIDSTNDIFIDNLKQNGFQAVFETDLENCLKRYGIAYKQVDTFYIFVYGVNYDEQTKLYNKFSVSEIDSESFDRIYDFINYENVAAHVDMKIDTWLKEKFEVKVFDMVTYYGVDSILGLTEINKIRFLGRIE